MHIGDSALRLIVKLANRLWESVLMSVSITLCSCGVIFQGTTEKISVTSEPPGAYVTMQDGVTMQTPFTTTVPRDRDLNFHFSKPGYESADLSDNSRVEPTILVLDVIPLLIPWAIDASCGAGFVHQRPSVQARLDPLPSASPETQGAASLQLRPFQ